MSIERVDVG